MANSFVVCFKYEHPHRFGEYARSHGSYEDMVETAVKILSGEWTTPPIPIVSKPYVYSATEEYEDGSYQDLMDDVIRDVNKILKGRNNNGQKTRT